MSPAEARRAALEAFGDVERIAGQVEAATGRYGERDGRRWTMRVESWVQDLRYALRGLSRSPGFSLVALLTLALGIGANVGIYSVVDGVFLRSPAVHAPGELVNVYTTCRRGDPRCSSSYPDYLDYREAGALADLAATSWNAFNVAEEGRTPRLRTGMLVSGNYFEMLGVRPEVGRLLQPEDDIPGATAAVAVLAWEAWRTDWGSDPDVVGRTVRLNGRAVEIVGVAARGFRGTGLTDAPALWIPVTSAGLPDPGDRGPTPPGGAGGVSTTRPPEGAPPPSLLDIRGARWMDRLVGRLAPGATVAQLDAEMQAISERLREFDPDARGPRGITVDGAEHFSLPQFGREDLTRFITLLAAVVGFTLLLACANVANLLLARANTRRSEMGIRRAIGASRGRIVRQLTVESVVLALLGGGLGLGVATLVVRVLSTAALPGGVRLGELGVGLDGRVLGFALGLSALTGLLFGLAPALRAGAEGLAGVLRGAADSGSRRGHRLRKTLVGVQVGLCLTLLIGSALFLQTLRSGLTRDLGYAPQGLAAVRFSLEPLGYGEEDGRVALEQAAARVAALPGVEHASWLSRIPFQNGGSMGVFGAIEGYDAGPDEEIRIEVVLAGPDALAALGIPLEAGTPPVGRPDLPSGWINRRMADRYFEGRSPLGRQIILNGDEMTVAGVVPDTDWDDVGGEVENSIFISPEVRPILSRAPITLVARTGGDPAALLDGMREAVRSQIPGVAFMYAQTAPEMLGAALATQRLGAALLTAFGALALVLATIGIGGVVGYLVRQRRRDIGLRIALGASSGRILGEIGREMAGPLLLGVAAGLLAAGALGRFVDGFLLGGSSRDPAPILSALVILALVAMAAVLIPARSSTRIAPMEALRQE